LQVAGISTGPAPALAAGSAEHEAHFGRGTYAPLGGAGGPPPRIARHLPIERDGATQFIAVEDVVAVHANAHYTYVFDGARKLFCPLAIGEVESRLDKNRFIRVHRSHIINIDRVVGHRRNGNQLASHDREIRAPLPVPVSRSRIGWLNLGRRGAPGQSPPASSKLEAVTAQLTVIAQVSLRTANRSPPP
jgi:DNA-binding LytR/AlgR family response regulator